VSSPSGVVGVAPVGNAFWRIVKVIERFFLHAEICGGKAEVQGQLPLPCPNVEPHLCSMIQLEAQRRAPLDNFSQASALSGLKDAFAVSQFIFYMQIKSYYYKTGSRGKAPVGGLEDEVPRR